MNFSVSIAGVQYDRLALMYFGDTEVWRTSTAEPTANGIQWTYVKDMSDYLYFWNSPQQIIFDLGNIYDSTYTGIFNTTLTATFFTSQDTVNPADLILPISARAAPAASQFTVPSQNASNTITLPQNANRAVFSVSACGQAAEEFWWANVLNSNVDTFDPVDGTLYGYSPWREVQVLIDGTLAGVQWPYPVIYTGGVVPGLWSPIVGIDAFDLREHEIDITPWLGILSDGGSHTFEIRVAGINDNGAGAGTISETVGSDWFVTGKIFLWLDEEGSITTGEVPTISLPQPSISISQSITENSTGANETLTYTTDVKRSLSVSSKIKTASGTFLSTWQQSLSATNYGKYTDYGAVQQNNQSTIGSDVYTGPVAYSSSYSYPLYANSTYILDSTTGDYSLDAIVLRSLDLQISGTPVFPAGLQPFAALPSTSSLVSGLSGSSLQTTQEGTASYFANVTAGTSTGFGSTNQVFSFGGVDAGSDIDVELYYRDVSAVNGTVVSDTEKLAGKEIAAFTLGKQAPTASMEVAPLSPKQAFGRGPGTAKQPLVQAGGN
jgi:hypothetical protein